MSIVKRLAICLVILAHLSACVTSQRIHQRMPVISEAQRDQLGTVGVVQITPGAKGELHAGARGGGAGAVQGAVTGGSAAALAAPYPLLSPSCSGSGGDNAVACIVLLPLFVVAGAAVGGVIGAVQAVPVDTAGQIEARLNLALTEVGKQQALRSEVVKAAARLGIPNVKEIAVGTATVDYQESMTSNIDTVLEVGLVQVSLTGNGGSDPQLALRVHAVARLMDVKTNAELYSNYAFNQVSSSRKFSEWNADEARLLKRELAHAYEILGTSIVEEVFLVVRSN